MNSSPGRATCAHCEQFEPADLFSQVLVFGRAGAEDNYISPSDSTRDLLQREHPSGFVQEGLIEIAVTDPKIGMAFYTLQQSETPTPVFRQRPTAA